MGRGLFRRTAEIAQAKLRLTGRIEAGKRRMKYEA